MTRNLKMTKYEVLVTFEIQQNFINEFNLMNIFNTGLKHSDIKNTEIINSQA